MLNLMMEAFSSTANFLTWSFFSFVACFSLYKAISERKLKNIKTKIWASFSYWICIVIFFIFAIANIILIIIEMYNKTNSKIVAALPGLISIIIISNAAIFVYGKVEEHKDIKSK
ncbi:hypothetical protein I4674_10790 [Proteus mirabilis]|nr:hypothetical protein [Proteus mirabilis]